MNFAQSRFLSFCWHNPRNIISIILRLVDRGDGIGDFQHCIVIIWGQEERMAETANVVGTNIGLRSFPDCVFRLFLIFVALYRFCCDFERFWVRSTVPILLFLELSEFRGNVECVLFTYL